MSKIKNKLRLPLLESLNYYYDDGVYPVFRAYRSQYSWMDINTIEIKAYMGEAEDTKEKVLEINIHYKHRDLYGRPGYYDAIKQYHWYNNELYRRGSKLKTIPKEVKNVLKILNWL